MTVGDPLSPLVQKIAELERRIGAVERPNALDTSGISSQVQWVKDNKTAIVWSKDAPSDTDTPGQTDGDAWYRTNTAEQIIGVWQWDGSTWVSLTDKATSDAAQAAHDASVAAAVAESVANTAQTTAAQAAAEAATAKDVADAAASAVVDAQTAADQAGLAADAANSAALNASNAAAAAAGVADGKGKVLIQSATPAVADRLPQNLWIDTTGGANTPKKWDGAAWSAVSDKAATDAAADAAIAYEAATQAAIAAALSKIVADNAQGTASTALTTANDKNKSIFSTSPASGTGYTVGDIWFQTSGGSIIGQWEFTSFGWVSRIIDNAVIANLDAGKITSGFIAAARIAASTITTTMLNSTAIDGMTITGALIRTAATGQRVQIDSNGFRGFNAAGTVLTSVGTSGLLNATNAVITGTISTAATGERVELNQSLRGLFMYGSAGTVLGSLQRGTANGGASDGFDLSGSPVTYPSGGGNIAVGARLNLWRGGTRTGASLMAHEVKIGGTSQYSDVPGTDALSLSTVDKLYNAQINLRSDDNASIAGVNINSAGDIFIGTYGDKATQSITLDVSNGTAAKSLNMRGNVVIANTFGASSEKYFSRDSRAPFDRPFAVPFINSVAERTALFGSTAYQGDRCFRGDLGYEETFFGTYNATTNPSGAVPMGWYPTAGKMPALVLNANAFSAQSFPANVYTLISAAYGTATLMDNDYFSRASGAITVKVAGWYRVSTNVKFTNYPGNVTTTGFIVNLNTASGVGNPSVASGVTFNTNGTGASTLRKYAAGDVLRGWLYPPVTTGSATLSEASGLDLIVEFVRPA